MGQTITLNSNVIYVRHTGTFVMFVKQENGRITGQCQGYNKERHCKQYTCVYGQSSIYLHLKHFRLFPFIQSCETKIYQCGLSFWIRFKYDLRLYFIIFST